MRTILMRRIFQQFCTFDNKNPGTQYNQWVLARAANHNHSIEHLKRKYSKDRYSIHKLTNLSFMCDIVQFKHKYNLTINQKIILLAQINHVIEVTGKDRQIYNQIPILQRRIIEEMNDPQDLICLGTFLCALASMGSFEEIYWQIAIDNIMANKFDEEYDELFGIIIGLNKYRQNLLDGNDFLTISKDPIIPKIPIIYRNSLEVLRQYITYNIFNLKECKIIFQALYQAKINQKFFWTSVRDWFNIYTKEQLSKKEFEQFFIMKESAIEKVLHDHGIIRPRAILQELITIVYVLSQNGFMSYRFIQFAQDLIIYTIQNGSKLYQKYQQISILQTQSQSDNPKPQKIQLNQNIKLYGQQQQQNVKAMQKKYKTIFINPIKIHDQQIIYLLKIFARAEQRVEKNDQNGQKSASFYDKENDVEIQARVANWLLMQLVKEEMSYTVRQLLVLVSCSKFLETRSKIDIDQFLVHKLQNMRDYTSSFSQTKQIMQILPQSSLHKLIPLLSYFLIRNHPSQILKLTKLIQSKNWIPYLIQYMLKLPGAVNTHQRYFSFEENCYFLLLLLDHEQYWLSGSYQGNSDLMLAYLGEKEKLKQQIKIVTYTRGFKLTVNSYFHKIMEKIDVVDFFEGGRG